MFRMRILHATRWLVVPRRENHATHPERHIMVWAQFRCDGTAAPPLNSHPSRARAGKISSRSRRPLVAMAAAAAVFGLTGAAHAANGTWINTAGGNWNTTVPADATNWSGG